jgi:hypothetical protein
MFRLVLLLKPQSLETFLFQVKQVWPAEALFQARFPVDTSPDSE